MLLWKSKVCQEKVTLQDVQFSQLWCSENIRIWKCGSDTVGWEHVQ